MPTVAALSALEILDSRGRPTIKVSCRLADGAAASASVPSGASTGAAEAIELRDGDASRYHGLGCRQAVANVCGEIASAVCGNSLQDQGQLDRLLIELDGTVNKSRLGANAILGVSLAFARASAATRRIPLHAYFASLLGRPPENLSLPEPTVNLFSGGLHAGGQVAIQDVLVVPLAATRMDEALAMVYAIYTAAAEFCEKKYGTRPLTADEGGLAPPFPDVETMLEDAVNSIHAAGLVPGKDAALAVDVAASHFFKDGSYQIGSQSLDSVAMVERILSWVSTYPIVSVEDGLAEDDWPHWPQLRERLTGQAIVLGDDLLCTHPGRIRRAIDEKAANALLLKVNQIGTMTEAADAYRLAREADWHVTVSARSGETEDNWLADLAVGWQGDHIKIGSITQSERLAKYNRLLEIEAETGWQICR